MASDDKTLRIEAHLQETIEVNSAGESVRDEAIRRQQSIEPPPASSSSVGTEDDVRRRIEEGDDSPLPEAAISAGAQAAAQQTATVGGEAAATGITATEAVSAGGAAATTGLAATLGPVGIAAGIVVAGFTAASVAAVALERALSNLEERLLNQFQDVSPEISLARAEQEIALLMKKIEVEPQVAGEAELFISQQTVIYEKLIEISGEIIEVITPTLINLMKFVQALLFIVEKILAGINWVQEKVLEFEVFITSQLEKLPLIGQVFAPINKYLEGILGALKEEDKADPFQQEAIDFLSSNFSSRMPSPFKYKGFRSTDKRKPPRKK